MTGTTKRRAAWWWIDRWRRSTAYTDMTAEEQGLYRNLLDEVWLRDDHIIPDDPRILGRVSGDPSAWERSSTKVLRWMKRVDGGWTHETALEVIEQSDRRAQKQQRYRDARRNSVGNAGGNRPGSPSPSPSPSPTTERTDGTERPSESPQPVENAGAPEPERQELLEVCTAIAERLGRTARGVIVEVSSIPASNGRPRKSFADPAAKGISIEWVRAALWRAKELQLELEKPVPL